MIKHSDTRRRVLRGVHPESWVQRGSDPDPGTGKTFTPRNNNVRVRADLYTQRACNITHHPCYRAVSRTWVPGWSGFVQNRGALKSRNRRLTESTHVSGGFYDYRRVKKNSDGSRRECRYSAYDLPRRTMPGKWSRSDSGGLLNQ